jgi:hypothetical protein
MTLAGLYQDGGSRLGNLSLIFTRPGSLPDQFVSAANVNTMLSNPTSYDGTFTLVAGGPGEASFSGTIPVPEPGSISLLAGLGLVCGRRVWRRRQQKQAAAV